MSFLFWERLPSCKVVLNLLNKHSFGDYGKKEYYHETPVFSHTHSSLMMISTSWGF